MVFLLSVCWLVALIASIIIIVKAFKVTPLWGLAVLFIPFANLVFIIKYWQYTRLPALFLLFSVVVGTVVVATSLDSPALQGEVSLQQMASPESGARTQKSKPSPIAEPSASTTRGAATSEGEIRDIPLRANARREVRQDADGFPVVVTTLGAGDATDEALLELDTQQILERLDELQGQRIRVVHDGGQISEGYLRREGPWLVVARRAQSGYFERKIAQTDIESLEVMR